MRHVGVGDGGVHPPEPVRRRVDEGRNARGIRSVGADRGAGYMDDVPDEFVLTPAQFGSLVHSARERASPRRSSRAASASLGELWISDVARFVARTAVNPTLLAEHGEPYDVRR